jgi:putative ABC transport system substrate-binding protein
MLLAGLGAFGASAGGVALLGTAGALAEWLRPHAVRRLGYVSGAYVEAEEEALQSGLRKYGWVEGQNLLIERRFSGDRTDVASEHMAELLHERQVELLVTAGSLATAAAKAATSSVPIVMLGVTDPVGQGLVASLARPGNNITGNTYQAPQLASKQLQLLMEVAPTVSRIAFLWNPQNPGMRATAPDHHAAARALGVELQDVLVTLPEEIEQAFETIRNNGLQALRVLSGVAFNQHKSEWLGFAARQRLPAMYQQLEWVPAGGLMVYVANNNDLIRRGGSHVDRILRGARPGDLPIEQPTTFEFYMNLTTAHELGLNIPDSIAIQVTQWFH